MFINYNLQSNCLIIAIFYIVVRVEGDLVTLLL